MNGGHQSKDQRPANCRNRLKDEGMSYPRSGCASCGDGGLKGCPHERRPDPPKGGSGVIPPSGTKKPINSERDVWAFVAETYQNRLRDRAELATPAVATILLVIADLVGAAGDTAQAIAKLEAEEKAP